MAMDKHLHECLTGAEKDEYILPFFWQHGEDHEILREEIDAIEEAGIREFCVESRTHPDFGHDKWWADFGFLLSEAKRRDMRVWLLDDIRFPTGYANGYVIRHPELRKTLIRMDMRDFAGPRRGISTIALPIADDESYVSVTAYRRTEADTGFTGEGIDLLPCIKNGLIYWDVPEGLWRVYYVIRTHKTHQPEWIDMLSPESCHAMIEAVYEPHYAHFSEYFGNTFKGFFSDEPCFGNDNDKNSKLGKPGMPLPWRDDLPSLIGEAAGMDAERVRMLLPALFEDYGGEAFHMLRHAYMDVITKLYRENFSRMLGEWCRAHGVMYIGHIIEDMGAHQRMGAGAGHYFRSMEYQDMAGMDIVLNQIAPGILDHVHTASVNARTVDAEFYHYILAKLPSSLSHTTERMQGRAMCEIFGAFGWAEGIPMMKYLADHMFSCGVNYFVPHAFTPKYPDPDCPPHFYARGKNPQIGAFGDLMTYMRRCAHMISGGTHRAPVAVLYNAEAEWAGGKAMLAERVGRALITAQIDFDVLCGDTLARCRAENGSVSVCGETYRAVVIPESEYLPRAILDDLRRLQAAGVPVIAAGEFLPRACEDGAVLEGCTAVPLSEVASYLRSRGLFDITVEPAQPRLRYYRTTRESRDTVMLFSEDVFAPSRFTLRMQKAAEWRIYDPWTGKLYTPRTNDGAVEIWLAPQGALLLVEDDTPAPAYDYHEEPFAPLSVHASVSVCEAGEAAFRPIAAAFGQDITAMEGMDTFSGTIRYTASVTLTGAETKLSLGEVGEVAAVWLNGKYLGRCVCPPYEIELGDALRAGENELTVEVVNNLGYRHRRGDRFSTYLTMPASGWIGPAGVR